MKAAEAFRLIESVEVATLASLRADGSPHLVPIVFALVGERIVTAIDGKAKQAVKPGRIVNIEADPRVSFLAHHYDGDWSRLWWVRVDGGARVLDHGAEFSEALAALRSRYRQYREIALPGPAIVITPERILGWAAV